MEEKTPQLKPTDTDKQLEDTDILKENKKDKVFWTLWIIKAALCATLLLSTGCQRDDLEDIAPDKWFQKIENVDNWIYTFKAYSYEDIFNTLTQYSKIEKKHEKAIEIIHDIEGQFLFYIESLEIKESERKQLQDSVRVSAYQLCVWWDIDPDKYPKSKYSGNCAWKISQWQENTQEKIEIYKETQEYLKQVDFTWNTVSYPYHDHDSTVLRSETNKMWTEKVPIYKEINMEALRFLKNHISFPDMDTSKDQKELKKDFAEILSFFKDCTNNPRQKMVLEKYCTNGGMIKITDKDLKTIMRRTSWEQDSMDAAWRCSWYKNEIDIERNALRYALFHEIGHQIDYTLWFPSHSQKFQEFHERFFNKLRPYLSSTRWSAWDKRGCEEFFAELVGFFLDPYNYNDIKKDRLIWAENLKELFIKNFDIELYYWIKGEIEEWLGEEIPEDMNTYFMVENTTKRLKNTLEPTLSDDTKTCLEDENIQQEIKNALKEIIDEHTIFPRTYRSLQKAA